MRNKKILISIIMCCSLLVAGCSNGKKENLDIRKIKTDDIVSTASGAYDYTKTFPSIPELAENSEVVVYGEVSSIEYLVGDNGICRANMEVKILEPLKGDYKTGDKIKVVKDQGIVSVKNYLKSFTSEEAREANREDFKDYSDEELSQVYVQQIEENDIMSEIGQKSVFFLEKSAFYDTEQTYTRLTGPEAEYTEVSDDQFVKTQVVGSELSQPYKLETFEKNQSREYEIDIYTLEEIISEIDTVK
ncbi:MAG: hypothetical protein Q4C84_12060 [Bacillota bacterium]|nr:hypothetical protein [Bacillota bacterium]